MTGNDLPADRELAVAGQQPFPIKGLESGFLIQILPVDVRF
jgi:hypothetical protein